MIYQDLALAGRQDIASNIFLGREQTWKLPGLPIRLIDWSRMEDEAETIMHRLGARMPRCECAPIACRAGSVRAWRSRVL